MPASQHVLPGNAHHGRIVLAAEEGRHLDSAQLHRLEQSFRKWAEESRRADVRLARRRILLIFLLIRYTGAKLNEVLSLDPAQDIDTRQRTVTIRASAPDRRSPSRQVQLSRDLSREIQEALSDPSFRDALGNRFHADPGFVRRKFYERAQACGLSKELGGPEAIRQSRAVELMLGNLPLPAVQKLLGHSTPGLTSSYVSFSGDDIDRVTRLFLEREASRKTSARNSFFGKIETIRKGDIQALVTLTTVGGHRVATVITNDSLEQLALREGSWVAAEVKAPWVLLEAGKEAPNCSADNRFEGIVAAVTAGAVNTEYTVRIADGTALCAVVSTQSARRLALEAGDPVWAMFTCFSVVLHLD